MKAALGAKYPEVNRADTSATIYAKEINRLCENLENNDILDFSVCGDTRFVDLPSPFIKTNVVVTTYYLRMCIWKFLAVMLYWITTPFILL